MLRRAGQNWNTASLMEARAREDCGTTCARVPFTLSVNASADVAHEEFVATRDGEVWSVCSENVCDVPQSGEERRMCPVTS